MNFLDLRKAFVKSRFFIIVPKRKECGIGYQVSFWLQKVDLIVILKMRETSVLTSFSATDGGRLNARYRLLCHAKSIESVKRKQLRVGFRQCSVNHQRRTHRMGIDNFLQIST
jgi:hypothetical protein